MVVGRERPFEGSSRERIKGRCVGPLCLEWTLFLRVDALGIVSHLCFPAAGGAFVAPRPAPDPGVRSGLVCGSRCGLWGPQSLFPSQAAFIVF